jgi:carboxyl-terminal processing protease
MKRILLSTLVSVLALTLSQAQNTRDHNFEVAKQLETFNAIYRNLDLMFVDTLNAEEVIGNGINAMLRSLDPYTEYYPASKKDDLKAMLTGKYAGIGALIRYHQKLKRVVIDEPYAGMPAAEVGLKKGDIILQIDDTLMTDKTVSYVSEHLRGDAGTSFVLKIKRPTTGKEMKFKITRRNIQLPEIPYYGLREDGIGYINLTTFVGEPSKPMRRAFVDLKQRGAKSLILDLRGNGGGSLAECIDIVNLWVPKGLTLVETRGKIARANSSYTTRLEPVDTLMPIVVLVNGETASASEITSGSIQDLDRGIIIGTRTYGKGLVQIPNIQLPYNGNLKLTTSKYYIPSGRCIQAINYRHSGGGYSEERVPDSLTHVFHTLHGREVRDGGGVTPDIEVKPDTLPNIAIYLDRLDSTEVMFDYVTEYIAKHQQIAAPTEFHLSDAEFADFKQRVIESGFSYDPVSEKRFEELVKVAQFEGYYEDAKPEFEALKAKLKHDIASDLDRNRETLCQLLEQDIIMAYYYQAGVVESGLLTDKQYLEAVRLLNNPEEYQKLLKGE